jgi:hypothetical protein
LKLLGRYLHGTSYKPNRIRLNRPKTQTFGFVANTTLEVYTRAGEAMCDCWGHR